MRQRARALSNVRRTCAPPAPRRALTLRRPAPSPSDYYPGGDKPYLVSGADDQTIRVWDYQTRSCISVLEGHTNNVCAVAFHPRLPFILSGSEDGTVRLWHNTTYRLETTLSYGFERAWTIATNAANNKVALGFDDGTIVVKLGREVPIASMDKNGKVLLARNNVIYTASVRTLAGGPSEEEAAAGGGGSGAATAPPAAPAAAAFVDGERIALSEKELGSVEIFPQLVVHNSNGRFVAVCGDNEFVIYTAQALRNKTFGSALDFAWSAFGVGDYGVRESTSKVRVFRNFKETGAFKPAVSAEAIAGGVLFCVRSADALCFYDWESCALVRRIEVAARSVHWNEEGSLVCVAGEDSFFVLRYNREVAAAALAAGGAEVAEEGVEAAFELQHEVADRVRSGIWVGDCFIYTNNSNRLNYYVGGEVITLAHLDRRMYLLGYLAKEGCVFLVDKTTTLVAFSLCLAVLEYQTAVVRRDFGAANRILPEVPREQHNNIAKFLDGQGFKEQALAVADDPDLKFDLALQLNKLDVAHALLTGAADAAPAAAAAGGVAATTGAPSADVETQAKWKQLMDLALATSNVALAEECALAARDLGALLLIYSSTGSEAGMLRVARMAAEDGVDNIAFLAFHSIGRVAECMQLLQRGGRGLEAECLRLVSPPPAPASALEPAAAAAVAAAPPSLPAAPPAAPPSPASSSLASAAPLLALQAGAPSSSPSSSSSSSSASSSSSPAKGAEGGAAAVVAAASVGFGSGAGGRSGGGLEASDEAATASDEAAAGAEEAVT